VLESGLPSIGQAADSNSKGICMNSEHVVSIITSLRERRWRAFEALVTADFPQNEEMLWDALSFAHGNDLDILECLEEWQKEQLGTACLYLLPAVARIPTINTNDALRLLSFTERLDVTDIHMVAESLKPHIERKVSLAVDLGKILREGHSRNAATVRVWADAFCGVAPQHAASYMQTLVTGTLRDTSLLAVLLMYVPLQDPRVKKSLSLYEKNFAELLSKNVHELGIDAWTGLTYLSELSPTATQFLNSEIAKRTPDAVIAICRSLPRVCISSGVDVSVDLGELISRLLSIALEDTQFQSEVDLGVARVLRDSTLRGKILPCLFKLAGEDKKATELFANTFDILSRNPDDFKKVLSHWLIDSDANHAPLDSLLKRCVLQERLVGLDAAMFSSAPAEQRTKAAYRLLALIHHGPTLCQFIGCVAEMEELGEGGLHLAVHMLNEVFVEYPGATENFLKFHTRHPFRGKRYGVIYRGVYAKALAWRRVLSRLPRIKDLRPNDNELHALASINRRINRDILKDAAKKSVFAGLFTNVHLAQGRRFVSHSKNGIPQIAEMSEASHFVELPSSELADPMRGMVHRMMLLRSAE